MSCRLDGNGSFPHQCSGLRGASNSSDDAFSRCVVGGNTTAESVGSDSEMNSWIAPGSASRMHFAIDSLNADKNRTIGSGHYQTAIPIPVASEAKLSCCGKVRTIGIRQLVLTCPRAVFGVGLPEW